MTPTLYADVNAVLDELLSNIQNILGEHFVGMYLYGSLAAGDFDQNSDVDFLVVSDAELDAQQVAALQEMHIRLRAGESKWTKELEGSYISREALRRYDPTNRTHPHIDRTSSQVTVQPHDKDWVLQRHVLREKGVTLVGPAIATLIEPVSTQEVREAVTELLRGWYSGFLTRPVPFDSQGYQAYTVLTMCRVLYTLEHGTVVSKAVAARWAQATLGAPWASLIVRAWAGRQNPSVAPNAADVQETLDLIRYTIAQAEQDGGRSQVGASSGSL